MARMVPLAVLLLVVCCATPGFARVHEVMWDVPGDGLQLPSISTAKCGDTIRFRCPENAAHGLYKLEPTNYNGTCPSSFDKPMIGEALYEAKKGCDFSIKLEEGPDFFLTSHVGGACEKNLKVYVHAVCIKSDNTFVSSLLSSLPALPSVSLRHRMTPVAPAADAGLAAAGYTGVLGVDAAGGAGGILMGGDGQPALGGLRGMSLSGPSSAPGVLEAAKQSAAADKRPVLASLLLVAAAVALLL